MRFVNEALHPYDPDTHFLTWGITFTNYVAGERYAYLMTLNNDKAYWRGVPLLLYRIAAYYFKVFAAS